jgi:ATP-binding cassette subfamily F protein 3
VIRLDAVTLAPGGHDLLVDASWHVRPGDRVGLVGRNGTGKTTVLRALAGELSPDTGTVHRRAGMRLGYLPQQAVSGSSDTVWNTVREQMHRLNALRGELEAARAAVERHAPGAVERVAAAEEAFRLGGGYAEDEQIGVVLHGLGFGPDTWHRSCDTFSGGWQMRIALARLLLSEPDVALLDEPTNHLDLAARAWLASFLARSSFAVVVVSHDRWLLDAVVGRIVEVRRKRLHHYVGGYSRFIVLREERAAADASAFDKQQAEIGKLERFVERFGAKATKAAQARSKQKALDRIDRVDAPQRRQRGPRFSLPEAPGGSLECLKLKGAAVGWPDGPAILTGLDLTLERGQRVAVLGPNGVGKSTLLHALAGRLPLRAGRRRVGDRVRVGVFTQDLAAELPPDQSALEHVTSCAPLVLPERIRAVLGALGLPGDAALRPIGPLSGGEKARVALARLGVVANNVLLLDEPTNHLDIETVEVLVEALRDFEGALLLVSHDRYLVEAVATHVWHVRAGAVHVTEGVSAADFDPSHDPTDRVKSTAAAENWAEEKKRKRERERGARRLEALEGEVEAAEAEVARIDEALFACGADYAAAAELDVERRTASAAVDALYAEWEALETLLAGE